MGTLRKGKALAAVLVIVLLLAPLLKIGNAFWAGMNSYYPSFLLLSNWVNDSILVITGVPIRNSTLNELRNSPFSLTNIYLGPYGILPLNLTLEGPFSSSARLNLNNTVTAEGGYGLLEVVIPPYTPYILLLASLTSPYNFTVDTSAAFSVGKGMAVINASLQVLLCSNDTLTGSGNRIVIEAGRGVSYVLISLGGRCPSNIGELLELNDQRVDEWLSRSMRPPSIPPELAKEYFLSLLVVKDDQNPYLGTFAASPSPLYLYNWVRDSSFAAMALQASGHYSSALKYWLWMAKAERRDGAWFTRYNFYTGAPDESYAFPEYDSLGLFEVGVYNYYYYTHNVSFL